MTTSNTLRSLYPELECYKSGYLKADNEHSLYFEEAGNPQGIPVLFLHGGPGSNIKPSHRRYFDPQKYRIVLFDQRGAGKSTPHASLNNNTTWHLVADIETLRQSLGIESWVIFGGSWGSTLSLAYAISHPSKVQALVLRGIFLCRPKEIRWFYQFGAHHLFPEEWERYLAPIPVAERHHLVEAYYKRLTSEDFIVQREAAEAWSRWEGATLSLLPNPSEIHEFSTGAHAIAIARIECHYFMNNAFFKTDNWILENSHVLKNIPTHIVHGRYDVVCPVENAWELSKAMPHAKLTIVSDAGHSVSEPGIIHALVEATDAIARLKQKS